MESAYLKTLLVENPDVVKRADTCINNVKLTLNCTKDYSRATNSRHHIDNSTYTKRPSSKNRLTRASLDNVSVNPWGSSFEPESTLRRSRSLALSREDIFSYLDYQDRPSKRRSQLIPRAKLIDRSSARNIRAKGFSADNLHTFAKTKARRLSSLTPPDYTPPERSFIEEREKQEEFGTYQSVKSLGETIEVPKHEEPANYSEKQLELSLPNYYPETYDTDNTDNISLTDNISSISLDICKIKYQSLDDLKWDITEPYESIPYDENIVLSANKNLYDTIENKPRKLRNPTPYHENYGEVNPRLDSPEEVRSLEQSDTNLDEIKLSNENVTKTHQRTDSGNSNIEENPLYETAQRPIITEQTKSDTSNNTSQEIINVPAKLLKTRIKVEPEECSIEQSGEQYKTVVTVESEGNPHAEENKPKESKTHSHSYLKEILETQKGSKKPLQNFIAKKFSNLSRRQSKEETNLTENQFHSLPDISISKNLRKCEKIDRKLRKCEKGDVSKENRFIVNIGKHFDISANSAVPVDFEVKIAKIPKKNKRHSKKVQSDEKLIEAVRQLNGTIHGRKLSLDENQNITEAKDEKNREMAMLYCQDACEKEFREKLGTMRSYWNKMMGNQPKKSNEDSSCKIVEVTTKVEEVKRKFEAATDKVPEKPQSKVQLAKQLFEPKPQPEKIDKLSPSIKESCSYFENNSSTYYENDRPFESLCPTSVEIVEANGKDTNTKSHKPLSKANSISSKPEFDHVRYKVVKSDTFQKKIFANCDKEQHFDDLIQYLQDYSFQELLIDNNIVIIEPIRAKVPYEPSKCVTSMRNITPRIHKGRSENSDKSSLNRRFFYHPIRVNKEVNDEELPNPDTVRQVRLFFEGALNRSHSNQELSAENTEKEANGDPGKDGYSTNDTCSHQSNMSEFDSQENLYDSIDNEIYCEYVSEDILEKIRECGTTVTYYGGRVVNHKTGQPVLTKVIMEEIKNNEERCLECKSCRRNSSEKQDNNKDSYLGVKFKILKSNSCSSRLELVGTNNLQDTKKKMLAQHKKNAKPNNMANGNGIIREVGSENEAVVVNDRHKERNGTNETTKKQSRKENGSQPKIIGGEMKKEDNRMTQWKEVTNENTYACINYNEKNSNKIYDFYHYDRVKGKMKLEDMDFEPYEVA